MTAGTPPTGPSSEAYLLRISRLTVDKLGVKLYDKASAVVAELVANAYDADAEHVRVRVPLGTELAKRSTSGGDDLGWMIEVIDDGHGMTPEETRSFYLSVGRDRRAHAGQGARSRGKNRAVMGRKGIGKLAPFGICRSIEVVSSGGERVQDSYLTTHFIMDFDRILSDSDEAVVLDAGEEDGTYREGHGTTIRLTRFFPRRVPPKEVFERQLARRFAVADHSVAILVEDTRAPEKHPPFEVAPFEVPAMPESVIPLEGRPVVLDEGEELPVRGWVGLAKEAYKNEEMAGVRVYARGKIVATTRDFEQPAGYTGEFTTRSYLVGEVHADWLDADGGEDLIRTDRQDILWDSDLGGALRKWGAELIKEVGARSRGPRRARARDIFMARSDLERLAGERFADQEVVDVATALGQQIGAFAAEDELADDEYVAGLRDVILSVAPHRALIEAFQRFSAELGRETALDDLVSLFGKARVAEMASYSQIAAERVKAIKELDETLTSSTHADESTLQRIIANAPYLIEPTWTVITQNQALRARHRATEGLMT